VTIPDTQNPDKIGKTARVPAQKGNYGSEGWGFESLRACQFDFLLFPAFYLSLTYNPY